MKHPFSTRLASAALSGALMLGSTVPAYAAGQGSSDVTLRVQTGSEPSIVNVTVPTEIPLEMDKDGKVTVTQDLAIKNLSDQTALELTALSVTGKNGWTVKDYSEDLAAKAEGTKELAMSFRGDGTTATGDVTLTPDNWNIGKSASLAMNAAAKLPKQSAESESKGSIAQVNYTFAAKEGTVTPEPEPGPVESQISNNWSKDKVIKDSVTPVTFSFDSTSADTKIVSVESSDPSVTVEKPAAAMLDLGHPGQEVWNVTAVGKGNATVTATLSSGEQTSFAVKVYEMKTADSEVAVPSVPDKKPGDSLTTGDITVDVPISTPEGDSTITVTPEIPEGTPPLTEGDNKIDVTVDVDGVKVHITIVITIASSNPSNGLVQSVQDAQNMGFTFAPFEDGVIITQFENKQFKREINIPEQIGEMKVVAIGINCFANQSNLTKITLPNSIRDIRDYAFRKCTGIKEFVTGEGYIRAGSDAFEGAFAEGGTLYLNCDTNLRDVAGDIYPFRLSNLENVVVGSKVENIGKTFTFAQRLKSVEFGKNVKTIGYEAFRGCKQLETVNLPDGLERIDDYAFLSCEKLGNLTIPSSVVSIGIAAFRECNGGNIQIPEDNMIKSLGTDAFRFSEMAGKLIFSNKVNIGETAFESVSGVDTVSVTHPESVVGHWAFRSFYGVDGGFDLTVGYNYIEEGTFQYATLKSVQILDGVKNIAREAFGECRNLQTITVPDTVETVDRSAFYNFPHIDYNGSLEGAPWGADALN